MLPAPVTNPHLCYALDLMSVVPAAVMCFIVMHGQLRFSPRNVYISAAMILTGFVMMGTATCIYFNCPTNWVMFAFEPLLLALYSYVVRPKLDKVLFCFLLASTLCSLAYLLSGLICAEVEAANPAPVFYPQTSLICLGLCILLGALYGHALYVMIPAMIANDALDKTWWPASGAIFLLFAMLVWASPSDYSLVLVGRLRQILLIVVVGIALVLLYLLYVVWRLSTNLSDNSRLREENAMLQMEEMRYNQLTNYMAATRAMRHDFRQHLRVIGDLANEGQYDELNSYLGQLGEAAGRGHVQLCANRALDAVASYYESKAQEQGVTIDWQLDLPDTLFVTETEMCAVVGNLVENALQAVAKLPEEERHVSVSARMLSDAMMGMTVHNPYAGHIRMGRDGLPRTRRKGGHGIGLASVQATAHRYDGTMDISVDNGEFVVSLLMYAPSEQVS